VPAPHIQNLCPPISCLAPGCCIHPILYLKNVLPLVIFGSPGCEILATGLCQIQETGMNVRIYLITKAIVLIVDTRLRLPTEIILKRNAEILLKTAGMQL